MRRQEGKAWREEMSVAVGIPYYHKGEMLQSESPSLGRPVMSWLVALGTLRQAVSLGFARQVLRAYAPHHAGVSPSLWDWGVSWKPPQVALVVKKLLARAGDPRDAGLIPGSERTPAVGNGNTLQYPCLENLMDRGAWQAAVHGASVSRTWLSNWPYHTLSKRTDVPAGQWRQKSNYWAN